MTIPHYVNEDRSEMRGIKPGWVRNGRRRKTLFGAVFESPRMPEHRHRMDRSRQRYINGRIETTLYQYPTRVRGRVRRSEL